MHAERLTRSDTPRPDTGIVHLGLGAFFRAFGCVYIADAMAASGDDWGIAGVSLRSAATRDALAPQGWAYTSATLGPDGTKTRVIEVLNDVLVAPENPDAVLSVMADPKVKIVSLTVTEKGYCHDPSNGMLNADHPDIQHDLSHDLPVSAIGYLVRALQRRRDAGVPPFTVLSCDNLPDNGKLVQNAVVAFAQMLDAGLAQWIKEQGRFPTTMVDRITPATTDADIAQLETETGRHDAAPVMHEPFKQWAIEDRFVGGNRPDFAAAGAEMVTDVTAHEHMKLRMLNGTHSPLAYTGYLAGHETIADTVADPDFAAYLQQLWAQITPTVTAPTGVDLNDYANALRARYANPAIRHRTWQIAMDGSQKLPQRILGTLQANLDAQRPSPALNLAVVSWMRYVSGRDEQGNAIDVQDPMAGTLRQIIDAQSDTAGIVTAVLGIREIFPSELAAHLQTVLVPLAENLWKNGTRITLRQVVTGRTLDS